VLIDFDTVQKLVPYKRHPKLCLRALAVPHSDIIQTTLKTVPACPCSAAQWHHTNDTQNCGVPLQCRTVTSYNDTQNCGVPLQCRTVTPYKRHPKLWRALAVPHSDIISLLVQQPSCIQSVKEKVQVYRALSDSSAVVLSLRVRLHCFIWSLSHIQQFIVARDGHKLLPL